MRVGAASVAVHGDVVGSTGRGLLALVGVERGDGPRDALQVADKVAHMRIFDAVDDGAGRDQRSVLDVQGEVLVVSQFTLLGDTRRGRRPDFFRAAPSAEAEPLVEAVVAQLRVLGLRVGTGRFGADMQVTSVNDGPFTVCVDTRRSLFGP